LYENVRILYEPVAVPYDLMLAVYDESVAGMPAADLEREVAKLFKKAKLIGATPPPVSHQSLSSKVRSSEK